MSIGRKLFAASIARALLTVTQIAIGFFMMPFLVTHLGSHWYGIWTIAGSVIAYFYLMDIGLGQALQICIARAVAVRDFDRANAVLNTSVALYSAISILILAVTLLLAAMASRFGGADADSDLVALILVLLGVNIAAEFPINAFAGVIAAQARYDLLTYSRFFMLLVSTGLTVYFVGQGGGVLTLGLIALGCGLASNVSCFAIARYCFPQMRIGWRWFDRTQVKELANFSGWSFLATMSTLIKYRVQALVIAFFAGASTVTHYVVGSRLADYYRDFIFQATNLSMPLLARYHALEQHEEMRSKLRFLTRINSLLAVFGAGMIVLLGQPFIARWMGSEYLDAYPVLVILVLSMAVEVMIDPSRVAMTAMGRLRFVGLLELIEASLNFALSIVLVSSYGMIGAALGTAIPLLALKLFIVPHVLCRQVQMPTALLYRVMIPVALVIGGYVAAYAWILHSYFVIQSYWAMVLAGIGAIPGYLVIAVLLFEREERTLLRRLLPFGTAQPASQPS